MKNTKLNKLEKKSLQYCLITINIMLAGTKIRLFYRLFRLQLSLKSVLSEISGSLRLSLKLTN